MRNFLKIGEVDVLPLLYSVQRQNLWNTETLRTTHQDSPHTQVDDILMRFNDLGEYRKTENAALVLDEHESINYPAWDKLPEAHPIIFNLMRRVSGIRLGRVMITRLAPGKSIAPHVDGGEHAAYYERHHIILKNGPGSIFRAGNETVTMLPGEVYWFNNAAEHEVINNSSDDRLTMIVDIRC